MYIYIYYTCLSVCLWVCVCVQQIDLVKGI